MKKITVLLLLFIFSSVKSQEEKYDLVMSEVFEYLSKTDSLQLNQLKNLDLKKSNIKDFKRIITQDVDFGISRIIYEFTDVVLVEKNYRYIQYKFQKYYFNNALLGNVLNDRDSRSNKTKYHFNSNITDFLKKRNEFYKTKLNESDFFKESLKSLVYGDGCGAGMEKVKYINKTELYLPENAETYVKWMSSSNLELQMWGYNQINYLLKKELIEINPFEEEIFNHIKERNAVIETCSGCTINLYERVWK